MKTNHNILREFIRAEIKKTLLEEKNNDQVEKDDEVSRKEMLTKVSNAYTKNLKGYLQEVTVDELSDAFMFVMDNLGYSRESKIGVLRNIKSMIQS